MLKEFASACVVSAMTFTPVQAEDTVVIRVGEYPDKPGKRAELFLDENYGNIYPINDKRELCEYYLNKQIALKISEKLKNINPNINVVLQDTKDRTQDLNAAGRLAKSHKPKVYLSVHTNASDNTSANGAYFLTGNKASWGDNNLADRLNNRLGSRDNALNVDYIGELNTVDDYDVVSVLGEYGFYTNRGDREKLTNPAHIEQIASATAEEINYTLEIMNRGK